jgi:hypothetical protein
MDENMLVLLIAYLVALMGLAICAYFTVTDRTGMPMAPGMAVFTFLAAYVVTLGRGHGLSLPMARGGTLFTFICGVSTFVCVKWILKRRN